MFCIIPLLGCARIVFVTPYPVFRIQYYVHFISECFLNKTSNTAFLINLKTRALHKLAVRNSLTRHERKNPLCQGQRWSAIFRSNCPADFTDPSELSCHRPSFSITTELVSLPPLRSPCIFYVDSYERTGCCNLPRLKSILLLWMSERSERHLLAYRDNDNNVRES